MSNESESAAQRRLPKIALSYGLFTLGGLAVLAPVVLLYRANPNRITLNKRLRANVPPPVRTTVGATFSVKRDSSLKLPDISFSPRRALLTMHDTDEVVPPTGQEPDPFHAFKAFSIATCIVGITAITSVLAVKSFLGVESPEQFTQLMTNKLAILVPSLITSIHRSPSETDYSPISPLDRRGQTATLDNLGSKNPLETNLDWVKDIEDQLERQAAAERAERQARRRK